MRKSALVGTVAIATALCSAVPRGDGQASAERAYVQASRGAVRAQPAAGAPVVDYLVTNAEVTVTQRTADWCAVESGVVKGFIACRLLGDERLTIPAVVAKLEATDLSARERLDWVARAFWISPSLVRFESAGEAMADALAPIGREMQEGRDYRPANAEFDAMKKRLQPGLRVARDAFPRPPTTVREADATVNPERHSAARPSFFAKDEALFAIALRPFTLRDAFESGSALADAASILQNVSFRARVGGTPGFGTDGPLGLWDVESAEVKFSQPVHVNAVTAAGTPTAYDLYSFVTHLGKRQCGEGAALSLQGRAAPGWSSAIVAWIGGSAPARKATVTRRTLGGRGQYAKRVVETVDLDGDGVADFSLWSGLDQAVASTDTFWKAVYVNLGGTWRLLAYRQEEDCT